MKPSHANSPKKHWLVFLSCLLAGGLWMPRQISAQIVPDSSLPINSTVTPNGNTLLIEGGTPIGGNLFHSFQEFSVPTGGEAYFNNSLTIENILTRITGTSISNIDGILRANGGANLFLLNPNGIVFGPNAALNIGGSFFASTADSLRLSDGSDFSATNPEAPPMLTINVPLGLQLGPSPGKIINQSRAIAPNSNSNNIAGLAVQPGETIGLVGGDISIEGGSLLAPVGKIELVSLSNGFWELGQEQNQSLETGAIANSQLGQIELTRESNVSTSGVGGGSIDVLAGKVSVRDGSQLVAITQGNQAGGGLRINAARSVEVIGNSADGLEPSRISSQTQGAGSAGDLTVETSNLTVNDGIISAATFSSGAGGNLTVRATDTVELVGGTVDGIFRGLVNASLATGDAGDLTVETGRLIVRNGGFIFSGNRNEGNGGNLAVRASQSVEVTGTSPDNSLPSTIQSAATSGSELTQMRFGESFPRGNAGDLRIETGSLIVRDGAEISTQTDGSGNSGNLTVVADLVEVRGTSGDGQLGSNLATDITGAGAGGDLRIETGRLLLAEGGFLSASTFGSGAGGNITIRASESVELMGTGFESFELDFISLFLSGELTLSARTTGIFTGTNGTGNSGNIEIETALFGAQDGTLVFTPSFARGTGGNITIQASEAVKISGSVFGASNLDAGAAGNIEIETSELILANGGLLGNSTLGSGSSGDILVRASEKVELSSNPAGALLGTGIFADSIGSTGAGGNIRIETRQLVVRDGARVSANSGIVTENNIVRVGGAAASIEAIASEKVEIVGISPDGQFRSALSSATFSSAPAGEVTVNTGKLIVRDGAEISTSAFGDGAGGDINITATEAVTLTRLGFENLQQNVSSRFLDGTLTLSDLVSGVVAGTAGLGGAGNITINTQELTLAEGMLVTAVTFGSGQGGRIAIQANQIETIGSVMSASTLANGRAGNIEIDTAELILREGAVIAASTINSGAGGSVIVRASERVELSSTPTNAVIGSGIFANSIGGTGVGGNIQINTARLSILDGGRLSTTTGFNSPDGSSIINAGGKGGNVEVRASESVEVSGTSGDARSQVTAATLGPADAGEVRISTRNLTVRDGAEISVATQGSGQGGSLTIEVSGTALFTGLSEDGRFSSRLLAASGDPALATQPTGAAGDLTIIGGDLIVRDGATVAVNSLGTGDAGALTAIAGEIRLDNRGTMTASPNAAQGGNINLTARDLQLRRGSAIATDAGNSDGGNISIQTDNLAALENSDISANAQAGFGGRVSINAEGIFGTAFRERQTPNSDITATSQLGPQFSGVVEINTPEVDPGAGLVKLPETVVDITGLVARDPCHHKDKSEFIITGRGGLPPSPLDPLSNPVMAIEWASREAASTGISSSSNTRASNTRASEGSNSTGFSREEQFTKNGTSPESGHLENHPENRHIVEATGWRVDANGDIILTADSPNLALYRPGLTAPSCGEGP